MSNSLPNSPGTGVDAATPARPRRALLIEAGSATRLQPQLAVAGYETRTATNETAPRAIEDFAPHIVLIELSRGSAQGGSQESLSLARRLRAEPATYVLPLVFVFDEDERELRNAALSVGADDYFSLGTPAAEMLARLDALFWRTEAGRRAASVAGDQRLEIDNFILMLDAVREAMRAGESGTLALLYATPARAGETLDKAARDRTLAEAHGFLKLNLRRIDEVTFYGPTTLLVYLLRTNSETAQSALSRLREQFIAERAGYEIAVGLASFPADGDDVESLIEKAEAAAILARDLSRRERVRTYHAREERQQSTQQNAYQNTYQSALKPPADTRPGGMERADERQAGRTSAESERMRADAALVPERQAQGNHSAVQSFPEERPTAPASFTSSASSTSSSSSSLSASSASLSASSASSASPADGSADSAPLKSAPGGRAVLQPNGADAVKAAIEAGARELERRAGGAMMPRRLLLTISDAARMAQINALIRSAGYEARAAFDGQQALDLMRIESPDLLLLDYQLQGMDGVETLRRLRKQSGGRLKLPVILLLPPERELARKEALELGARDVITTPYDPAELLTSVRLAGNTE